jgi:hypothetical protein
MQQEAAASSHPPTWHHIPEDCTADTNYFFSGKTQKDQINKNSKYNTLQENIKYVASWNTHTHTHKTNCYTHKQQYIRTW